MEIIGYLGPAGTFSEEAAISYRATAQLSLQAYPSLTELILALVKGEVSEAVVPLENSMEGTVQGVLELLLLYPELKIKHELAIAIKHNLFVKKGIKMADIEVILSHQQALAQCRHYLGTNLPAAALVETASTAEAFASVAAGNGKYAAVGSRRAGEIFDLQLLAADIQECEYNTTRFIVVSNINQPPTGHDKTSIVFGLPDYAGSLVGVLQEFAAKQINLTRIESRPAKRHLGEYYFFVDFAGHQASPEIAELLQKVAVMGTFLKVLGSYPANIVR